MLDEYRFRRGAFFGLTLSSVLAIAASAASYAQPLPNPYRLVDGWAKLPGGREIGAVGDVDIDVDGRHVWAVLRCDAGGDKFGYECLDSELDVVVKFAPDGNTVATFGGGMFIWPHGLEVDPQGNVWVTDAASTERSTGMRASRSAISRLVHPSRTASSKMATLRSGRRPW